ncbi:GntR family transcriptional regulator [Pseudarthrobacter sp. NPDC058362]|uniref:GntR family transcriptional regulator n=1 Tax=unclassified Pseudarthrobacter TaxID=2647000 RepID=UPI0036477E02
MAISDAVRRQRPAQGVYEALKDRILDNRIPPGTKVSIDAVARELGVSPTPVREALQRLQGDNLVVATSGRGYSTTALLDAGGLRDLFEFRLLVEPWAARAAAVDRLDNPARRLDGELDDFRARSGSGGDIRRDLVAHDTHFHELILGASGNGIINNAFGQTHCHLHLFRLYPADVDGTITIEEHRQVSEAIRACDPARAEEAMYRHLVMSYRRFAEAFDGGTAVALDARRAAFVADVG